MKIEMPVKVQQIINRIQKAGYEAYAVGGCIRDSILGRVPDDWDITTSATPQQVKELFTRTVDTGIKHGTVTVMLDKEGFEVTTYRIDGKYEDGRHPTEVTFTPNLEEDLKRRDFTMNAMAYNEEVGLVDLFGGEEDMKNGLIRCVGDPIARFTEDALRMMRAVRFAAQLGYNMEENTARAIKVLAANLGKISAERIQVELTKLVVSPNPGLFRLIYETGIADIVLPEFCGAMEQMLQRPDAGYSLGEHTLRAMEFVSAKKELRLAMLLHDLGKVRNCTGTYNDVAMKSVQQEEDHAVVGSELARTILRRLRYDNDTIHTVCRLVRYHNYGKKEAAEPVIIRKAMNLIGEDLFPMLFEVQRADILAHSPWKQEEKLAHLQAWEETYHGIVQRGECVSLKTLALTGQDLIAMGMKPGKGLGETLSCLLQLVLEEPQCNTKECLVCWLEKNML